VPQFEDLHGLPLCGGAIDGSFIPMKRPPRVYGFRYWCYKCAHATLLLAVVDAEGLFWYINTDSPGSMRDAAVFSRSKLKRRLERSQWLSAEHAQEVEGVQVRPYLVADAAFALMPYMMYEVFFRGNHHAQSLEGWFNCNVIRTRRVVENAFGRLKNRFLVLTARKLNKTHYSWGGSQGCAVHCTTYASCTMILGVMIGLLSTSLVSLTVQQARWKRGRTWTPPLWRFSMPLPSTAGNMCIEFSMGMSCSIVWLL
jgi:hypothetical protein